MFGALAWRLLHWNGREDQREMSRHSVCRKIWNLNLCLAINFQQTNDFICLSHSEWLFHWAGPTEQLETMEIMQFYDLSTDASLNDKCDCFLLFARAFIIPKMTIEIVCAHQRQRKISVKLLHCIFDRLLLLYPLDSAQLDCVRCFSLCILHRNLKKSNLIQMARHNRQNNMKYVRVQSRCV